MLGSATIRLTAAAARRCSTRLGRINHPMGRTATMYVMDRVHCLLIDSITKFHTLTFLFLFGTPLFLFMNNAFLFTVRIIMHDDITHKVVILVVRLW